MDKKSFDAMSDKHDIYVLPEDEDTEDCNFDFHDVWEEFQKDIKKIREGDPVCTCGAKVAKTTHATYCDLYRKY